MPLLQFGQWRPDVADYQGDSTKTVLNVLPRGDGYGPCPSFSAYSLALPAICRGAFYALKSDGSVITFAGTSDRIYQLNNTDFSWKPVSKVATVTISAASPGVITHTAHPFAANDPVVFSNSGGALPAAITAGTVYYVKTVLSVDTYTISATAGGAAINTATTGTGTHSATSAYSALSSDANWRFAQFGNNVIAVQENIAPQVFDLSSSTAFADLGGSPPQAAYVDIVGRFVVLSGLLSNPYRIHWSGLNAITTWTSGTNSSDYQDFADGGIVRGVAGGENGVIFQDQAIRRMTYVPGSPLVFQIDRIMQDEGIFAPYSIVRAGETVYFHSVQGFHKIEPGGVPQQIGRERVDRTFMASLDRGNLQLFQGAQDPRTTFVYWAWKSGSGANGLWDNILGYDSALDRFFPIQLSGEFLLGISQTGLTLEGLDSISASIDALTLTLDAYASAVQPEIGLFNSDHKAGFLRGSNLEATLETSEQGTDGRRIYMNGWRPITDAATVYGSLKYRDTQQATATTSSETLINSRTGRIDVRRDARYMRLKNRIPAGTSWSFIAGVEPDVKAGGTL
jgi:hypothetical protein